MKTKGIQNRIETDTRKLKAKGRFGKYKEEESRAVRIPKLERSESLERIKSAWECLRVGHPLLVERHDPNILELIKGISYTPQDVERFSIMLAGYSEIWRFSFKSGLFLSRLINNCEGSDFVVHTRHIASRVDFMGLGNIKNIVVEGNAGVALGCGMKGGSIFVKGNADARAGADMEGGCITIMGNAGEEVGSNMEGGVIRVEGRAGQWPGKAMKGGEIHISGRIGRRVVGMQGGRIYHKGKQIHPVEEGHGKT